MLSLTHLLPRCSATTLKGRRCQMLAAGPGRNLCRYHDAELKPETVKRNTIALRRYWQRYHAAKALAATADIPGAVRETKAPGPTENE